MIPIALLYVVISAWMAEEARRATRRREWRSAVALSLCMVACAGAAVVLAGGER